MRGRRFRWKPAWDTAGCIKNKTCNADPTLLREYHIKNLPQALNFIERSIIARPVKSRSHDCR